MNVKPAVFGRDAYPDQLLLGHGDRVGRPHRPGATLQQSAAGSLSSPVAAADVVLAAPESRHPRIQSSVSTPSRGELGPLDPEAGADLPDCAGRLLEGAGDGGAPVGLPVPTGAGHRTVGGTRSPKHHYPPGGILKRADVRSYATRLALAATGPVANDRMLTHTIDAARSHPGRDAPDRG